MTDGVINVNKPKGWTSQDVCAKLRGRLHIKKIGHTGTLDPMATGVLPVCTGKATRIIEYYDADIKRYKAEMKLGIRTDTLDITGTVFEEASYSDVGEENVRAAFRAYTGRISQVPPKYSALKIGGKRAYELAREGADFEIKAREIEIFSNEVTRLDLGAGLIEFEVSCSKGTYIRTICDDIGRSLGCGAAMSALERTGSGYFSIEDSVGIEELCEMSDEEIKKHIIPMDETLEGLGVIQLDNNRVTAFINGNSSRTGSFRILSGGAIAGIYKVYQGLHPSDDAMSSDRHFLGIAAVVDGTLVPKKILI